MSQTTKQEEQLSKYDIEDTFDKKKFDKMDYVQKQKYANELEDKNVIYRTKTKIYIITALAEALEKQEYPILDIKQKIYDGFEGRVDSAYIAKCLPEKFKRPQKVKAGKKIAAAQKQKGMINSATGQVLQEPELQFKEDDDDDEEEDINTEVKDYSEKREDEQVREELPDEQPSIAYTEEYVKSLEQKIEAMGGHLPYGDMQATRKIAKLSKQMVIKLEEVSRKAKKEVFVIMDMRTEEIIEAYSDKDYNKMVEKGKINNKT